MIKRAQVDELEKLVGQLEALHAELSGLAKKSPKDGVNNFKLQFINLTLRKCNSFLGKKYKPFDEFSEFNPDDVPSNSDVTFTISQYMQATEKYRSDNIHLEYGNWYYTLPEGEERIHTAPPAKIKE